MSVKSGELWDSKGNKTGQLDTIIIRDDCPCLHFGANDDSYLVEGVFSVVEIKSNLSTAKFQEAVNVMQKVEGLSINPPPALFSKTLHRPLKIVFAYKGATFETIWDYAKNNSIDMKIFDIVCILERGMAFRTGLIFSKDVNDPSDFIVINGSAGALGFLYLHLVQLGSGYMSSFIDLRPILSLGKIGTVNFKGLRLLKKNSACKQPTQSQDHISKNMKNKRRIHQNH